MKLYAEPLNLDFKHAFGISRWTRTSTQNVLVRVERDGVIGLGEGAPNRRYGESQEEALEGLRARQLEGQRSAQAALDMALCDEHGKRAKQPVYELLGFANPGRRATSFTIGLDTPEVMAEKARDARAFKILKIKVGTERDQENVTAIRQVTNQPIRVDANEGWQTKEEALRHIEWLADQHVELVEQPLPAGRLDDMAWLKARSPLPLVADEDCEQAERIPALAPAYDGINIKLDKSGGLHEARRMIDVAKAHGLSVMLGCMISSSLSITAAFHLAAEAQYLDLDGHLLLAEDPFRGVQLDEGELVLPGSVVGLGVTPR